MTEPPDVPGHARWLGYAHADLEHAESAQWYRTWGFQSLPGGPDDRLWLPMKRVRASLIR